MITLLFDIFSFVQLALLLLILSFFSSSIWGSLKKPLYKTIGSHQYAKLFHYKLVSKLMILTAMYTSYYLIIYLTTSTTDVSVLLETQKRLFIGSLNLILYFVIHRWADLLFQDHEKLTEIEEKALLKEILAWKPPPKVLMDAQMKPMNLIFNPKFFGLENIPSDKPILFVGNHAIMGVDMPLLISNLYKEKNIYLRGLADTFHFSIPIWGEFLKMVGAVVGSRPTCSALMGAGEHILVYPGGAHEVLKKKSDDKYELKWKQRTGFAKLAIEHNYTIVPVCAVGTNEMLDIITDVPVGWLFGGSRGELSIPLVKPPSLSKIQRVYFGFGKPIDTSYLNGDSSSENCFMIRDQCKSSLEQQISATLKYQQNDPERYYFENLKKSFEKESIKCE